MGTTSRFPSGRTAKLLFLTVIVGLVALDTTGGDFDLSRARAWFDLVLPWIPLFAVLIGPRVGAVTWFAMFAVIIALGADPLQVSGTALPTMLLLGLCAFVLVWRAAVILTAGVLVMFAIAVLVNPAKLGLAGVITFATFMVLAAAAGFGLSLLRSRLERSARRVAELRAQQARVRAEERTRLAYELHDIVANQVTLIAMQARRAEFADPEKTGQILENIGRAAGQTLQDLRSLVLLLKSETDEDDRPGTGSDDEALTRPERDPAIQGEAASPTGGLVQELHQVVDELEQAGFTVQVGLAGPVDDASAGLRQTLGRTLHELGTNVLKHGDPNGIVELRMAFTGDEVTLSASNQISAATPIFSSGTGLEAMRARCDVFGGHLATFAEGGRWTTSVSFPTARPLALTPSEGTS
ncbi:MAG: hypothetical protein BGO95_03060 [Micrococcales bacterium 73-13]|nr:MAG: hypothetical protein BGO95_03060 [Micrococcales bacterium 73-13]